MCQSCGHDLKLNGRYLVGKKLGHGGFGATFLAVDTGLPGKPVCVVKQMRPGDTSPNFLSMARELFEREAETLGKLGNHPQVPRLLGYFEEYEQFFLVQEFVKGSNLQKEVKDNGPLSEEGVRQFLSEILPLVGYIHSQKVIHRDIKPANIIRREIDKKLVMIDFGAVKNRVNEVMAADLSGKEPLTSFALGTPGYAPPEQMAMRPTYASDIYSLGATCIYLLTGRSPRDIGHNSQTGALDWEPYVDIGSRLKKVLRKMLAVGVDKRYQSVQAVLEGLEMEAYDKGLSRGLVKRNPLEEEDEEEEIDFHSQTVKQLAEATRIWRARRGLPTSKNRDQETNYKVFPSGMSQDSHLRKLSAKELYRQYRSGRRDFSQVNLYQLDLEEANLKRGIFRQSNLMQVNLCGADLRQADFANANLRRVILREAKLNNAFFSNADLQKADLRKADLTLANFQGAKLDQADFSGANLTNAKITEEQLKQAKVNWATIMPNGKRALW